MYLTIDEFKTHAYDEELAAIIRADETIGYAAIDIAMEMVKSKLMRYYDTDAIFDKQGKDRHPLVLKIVKDIAIWQLIGLSNPSIDYEDKKYRYEQAVSWLDAVYQGMPANLPARKEVKPRNTSFTYHSNPRRKTHF